MKKIITLILTAVIVSIAGYIGFHIWRHHVTPSPTIPDEGKPAPGRMLDMGPVGTGIESTEVVGNVQIRFTADRLWFKKTRTFGFANALMKKIAAKNFQLSIYRAGRKLFAARKEILMMPLNQNRITMSHPDVLYPRDLGRPEMVQLDKKKMLLHLRYANKTVTWKLSDPAS